MLLLLLLALLKNPIPSHAVIKAISLIGERHSGTNFVGDLLMASLDHPRSIFINHERLCGNCNNSMRQSRFKHRFMFPDLVPRHCCNLTELLIVVMLRNPFDWTMAMKRHCHCRHTRHQYGASKAKRLFLNVSLGDFIRLKWKEDVFSDVPPVALPLDPSSMPAGDQIGRDRTPNASPVFDSVLHMRACKLKSFLDIRKWAPNVIYLRQEDILGHAAFDWIGGLARNYSLPRRTNSSNPAVARIFRGDDKESDSESFSGEKSIDALWRFIDRAPGSTGIQFQIGYRGSMSQSHHSTTGSLKFDAASHMNRSLWFNFKSLVEDSAELRQHVSDVNNLMYHEVEERAGYGPLELGGEEVKEKKEGAILSCGWV